MIITSSREILYWLCIFSSVRVFVRSIPVNFLFCLLRYKLLTTVTTETHTIFSQSVLFSCALLEKHPQAHTVCIPGYLWIQKLLLTKMAKFHVCNTLYKFLQHQVMTLFHSEVSKLSNCKCIIDFKKLKESQLNRNVLKSMSVEPKNDFPLYRISLIILHDSICLPSGILLKACFDFQHFIEEHTYTLQSNKGFYRKVNIVRFPSLCNGSLYYHDIHNTRAKVC